MPSRELDLSDPSVVFGQEQCLYAYNMASSLSGDTTRPVIERAHDAARTAIRLFERSDVNVELAVEALMGSLESGFNTSEIKGEEV